MVGLAQTSLIPIPCEQSQSPLNWVLSVMAFYEKVIKVKADVAAYLN